MKLKTQGLSLKIPAQAITTLVVGALAYFGVDLDPELSAALGVVIGFAAGYLAPAAPVTLVPVADREAGLTFIEVVIVLLVIAVVALAVLVL